MAHDKWYVLTGGPNAGKTTVLRELEKLGHKAVGEAARAYVESRLAKGMTLEEIRSDIKSFQEAVFKNVHELHLAADKDVVTFFDRGYHDAVAYLKYFGEEASDFMKNIANTNSYSKVFVLDMLPYVKDGVRDEDEETANALHQQLRETYKEYGHEVIDVPVLPPAERAQFILNHIDQK